MNKAAIRNFSIWARSKLIADVRYRAGLLGVTEAGVKAALPQSAGGTEFYDIGTGSPYSISGKAVRQRQKLVEAIREKEQDSDYQTAYKYIVEEVAYTWFNRLIAIRFMEVNDYLPSHIRVLSSDSGKLEPDLVTFPFDGDLPFTPGEEQLVARLKEDNLIDELFRMLFVKQCNALNGILPGLFEQTDDYTELLLSLSVTDRDGVVYHLTHDIDEDDFNVEKGGQVEIIGWLYQYYNTEPKNAVFDRPSGAKIHKDEVPAATQLFTPDWIVRYMVENSLGRFWLEYGPLGMACGNSEDALRELWTYLVDEAEQDPQVEEELDALRRQNRLEDPTQIKFIDPCMGSGHILVYAFEVLFQIYDSLGYAKRDIPALILEHNLYGLDIDKRAYQLAYFALMMKARQYDRRFFSRDIQPMVYSTTGDEDGERFGSLLTVDDPGEKPEYPQSVFQLPDYQRQLNVWNYRRLLAQKYHVVCTNPPYMAASNMNDSLSGFIKQNFAAYKSDFFSAFLVRCGQMALPIGKLSFFSPYVWMFIHSYEQLRRNFCQQKTIETLIQFEYSAFEEATVPLCAFVCGNCHVNKRGCYFRLTDFRGGMEVQRQKTLEAIKNRACGYYYEQSADSFSKLPGSPIAYWAGDGLSRPFEKASSITQWSDFTGAQNKTADNERFLRLFWEVKKEEIGPERHWVFYAKGGEFRKHYGNLQYIVDWSPCARDFYVSNPTSNLLDPRYWYQEGITYTMLTSKAQSFRYMPPWGAFDMAGPVICGLGQELYYILAFLNSVVAGTYLNLFNPTLNLQAKDIKALPLLLSKEWHGQVDRLERECIAYAKADWDSFETSWDFARHPLVRGVSTVKEAYAAWEAECDDRFRRLKANEEELNRIFIHIYGLQRELSFQVEDRDVTVRRADLGRDVRSLLSYAVGCMFGRYSLDVDGLAYAGGQWDGSQYATFLPDPDGILPITDEEYFDDDIVGLFCAWLKKAFGPDTLEENLDFIAKALGNKGATSREVIRNYFLKDFFADHCKTYQKRPIYWLFHSGRQNGFQALIYLHRCTPDAIGALRVDYLHRMQRIYESEIDRMQDMIDHSSAPRETAAATKRKEKLQKQLKETREYDEKISHLALSPIELDLNDGVRANYRKFQTASDGKLYEVLADSKNMMGKK